LLQDGEWWPLLVLIFGRFWWVQATRQHQLVYSKKLPTAPWWTYKHSVDFICQVINYQRPLAKNFIINIITTYHILLYFL
jgi:hypothetical protein